MPRRKSYIYRLQSFAGLVFGFELFFWIVIWQLMRISGVFTASSAGERLTFLNPNYAWLFTCLIVLITVFLQQLYKRNSLIEKIGNPKTIVTFLRPVSTMNVFWRYFFIRNAIVFIIFALMQPVLGTKDVKGQSTGVELLFALDVSNSMNTRDTQGGETRLEVAKRAMNQIVNQSSASRVGLLIFAGNAYPQLPLTADKRSAKMYIDDLSTNFVSNQGTNIAAALKESSKFFSQEKLRKVLVLVTDGEDHEGGMESAYSAIKDKNIEVLILGIGTEEGGIVPRSGAVNDVSLKDELGRSVISKVNQDMLEMVGSELNAEVVVSNESFPNVSKFLTHINKTSGANSVNLNFKVKENRYQYPLSLAILSVFVLFIMESRPNRKKIV